MAEMPQLSSSNYTNTQVDWNGVFDASLAPGTRRVSSLGTTALTPAQFYQATPIQAETLGEVLMANEVDIRAVLEAHNQKRVAMINKTVKERTEQLEPARVRDLRMTVVTIAQF